MSSFEKTYAQHSSAVVEANSLNKVIVFDALAAAGISSIIVTFDGYGDSGQVEDLCAYIGDFGVDFPNMHVTTHAASWGKDGLSTRTHQLREAVENLCYGYLEQTHGGWENNDGAFGEFSFDVQQRTITLDFNGRFTETWHDAHSF